jgi:hypothetical protein
MKFLQNQLELFVSTLVQTWQTFWSRKGALIFGFSFLIFISLKLFFLYVGSLKLAEPAYQVALIVMGVVFTFVLSCYYLMIKYSIYGDRKTNYQVIPEFGRSLLFVSLSSVMILIYIALAINIPIRSLPLVIILGIVMQFSPIATVSKQPFNIMYCIFHPFLFAFINPIAVVGLSIVLFLIASVALQLQFIWFVSYPTALAFITISQVNMYHYHHKR